jgi:hypothetical protein
MRDMNLSTPMLLPQIRIKLMFLLLLSLLMLVSQSTWAYPIPDTGQTESYAVTFGEDSDYLINPPSYTKLDAAGNDLADSATSWVMVRDNVTGLIWEVKTDDGSVHDKDNRYTWYDSNTDTNGGDAGTPGDGTDTEDFIAALNAESFGGYTDWRLPTPREMSTIANIATYDPGIDTAYFPNTMTDYWSSMTRVGDTERALYTAFGTGIAVGSDKKSDINYVRAMRNQGSDAYGTFVINGDGTTTSLSTGLMWQQGTAGTMNWPAALSYCESLEFAGYADWRLPSIKELSSIVDHHFYDPAIDTTVFPDTESKCYWSSSAETWRNSSGLSWVACFEFGGFVGGVFSNKSRVRCMRGGQNLLFNRLLISSPAQISIWNVGSFMPIRWDTAGISGNVKISISTQGGKSGTFQTIVESTPNNGSYDWIIDAGTSVNCSLRVEPLNDSSKGTTQSLFTINSFSRKAIIVAGGGDYEGNSLWDATRLCASYAYSTLNVQGYASGNLYYLSSETNLDLDNDGVPEVSADATNANLEYAIKTWAADGDNLVVYLVGHGGAGTFRIGENELLNASELDRWLDEVQTKLSGFVVVLYDACHSGSFVPALTPEGGKARVVITSAASDEVAVFQADGGLSFGYQFFSYLFGGGTFYKSFVHGKKSVEGTLGGKQTPQIEGNANGIGNEKGDQDIARGIKVGDENKTANDIPVIAVVSPAQTISGGEITAAFYAEGVLDADGISEVFAVIRPPDTGTSDAPVTDLPTVTFTAMGSGRYEGVYERFTQNGSYHVAIFARDSKGGLSLPAQTSVSKGGSTCLPIKSDLGIQLPCVDYNGNLYGFILDFYRNPDDMSGYYWKMVMSTLTTGSGSECIPIGSDLSMPMDCVSYNGTQYGFTLRFYNNPYDPSGYYWKMGMSTLVVK